MKNFKIGNTIEAIVTGIEKYGIFIAFDDYVGLIHISELSDHFVSDVSLYAIKMQFKKYRIWGKKRL